jgi:hypothetical protein
MRDLPSKCCRLTKARIEPISETQFQFPDARDSGFIADILVVPGWSGDLVELIAWKPEQPNRWWLRSGLVPLIGEDLAELAKLRKEPTWLANNPSQWFELVHKCREDVACVIDWTADPRLVMTGLNVHCSASMSRRLKQWWVEHAKMNFSITTSGVKHAA